MSSAVEATASEADESAVATCSFAAKGQGLQVSEVAFFRPWAARGCALTGVCGRLRRTSRPATAVACCTSRPGCVTALYRPWRSSRSSGSTLVLPSCARADTATSKLREGRQHDDTSKGRKGARRGTIRQQGTHVS